MEGSDMLVARVDDATGVITIEDRYALAKQMPILDDCQDWVLVNGSQEAGMTTIEVTRKLVTNDTQDRSIPEGLVRIVYAFGTSDVFGYHGPNRTATAITFYGESVEDLSRVLSDPNIEIFDMFIDNYTIPASETFYVCQTWQLPLDVDRHIIALEPIIPEASKQFVHHFGVLWCAENETW